MTTRVEVITDLVLSFVLLAAMCGCLSQWDRETVDDPLAPRSTCRQIAATRE
ncbi:MAG: hypothetical protein JWP87_5318 [Labilithrix sp.]|nr:hypothetical protein [Labilithrix sp.]